MATSFPTGLDAIQRVVATDLRNAPGKEGHVLHNNLCDAVEALQAKVGVNGSAVVGSIDARLADVEVDSEAANSIATIALAHSKTRSETENNDYIVKSIMSGGDDETYIVSSCVITDDTTNFIVGDRGKLLTMSGAVSAFAGRDFSGGYNFGKAQAVGLAIYLPDASKVTSVSVYLYKSSDFSVTWARAASNAGVTLQNGWNYIRWTASAGGISTGWGTIYRARVYVNTNAATTATIGHLYFECRRKASIVMIADGPYKTFKDIAYPEFKSRNWPIVLAVDPGILGQHPGTIHERMSESDVLQIVADDNGNECSFHGWLGDPTSSMTSAQIRTDTRKAQKWLIDRGFVFGAAYRAAYVQNLATNHAAATPYLIAEAASDSNAALDCWPPVRVDNVPRYHIAGQSQAQHEAIVNNLVTTNGVHWCFMHGVADGDVNYATQAEFDSWISACDAAVAAGNLEFVTVETLFRRSGGRILNIGGRLVARWSPWTTDGVSERTVVIG